MAFPRSFYKEKVQTVLSHTANCTGVLMTPLDFINKPERPWVSAKEIQASEVALETKTLIFADHFFQSRDAQSKIAILQKLKEAQIRGFIVLILWPDGELKEWDGQELPNPYVLNIETYSHEVINHLAWKQCKLSAGHVFILDYWGINELNERPRNFLEGEIVEKQLEDFFRLISTAQEPFFKMTFGLLSKEQVNRLFKLLSEDRASSILKKFIDFDFRGSVFNEENLRIFLKKFPWLRTLSIGGSKNNFKKGIGELIKNFTQLEVLRIFNIKLTVNDLPFLFDLSSTLEDLILSRSKISGLLEQVESGKQIKGLKYLRFYGVEISQQDLRAMLKSCPSLEHITFNECGILGFFRDFTVEEFSMLIHLKVLRFGDNEIKAEDLRALLRAFPSLERIDVSRNCISGAFDQFKAGELYQLKTIELVGSDFNAHDLAALFRAAPMIESISLDSCEAMGFSEGLKPGALRALKEIGLDDVTVLYDICDRFKNDLIALFKAAPSIRNISLRRCIISGCFDQLRPNELEQLNVIYLNYTNININDLNALFKAALHLEEIGLSGCAISGFFEHFKGELKNIKKIEINELSLTKGDLIVLFQKAVSLEELSLSNHSDLSQILEQLKPGQLKKLRKIIFNRIDYDNDYIITFSPKAIQALLDAAPSLEKINFTEYQIRFSGELDEQTIKKLKKLGFINLPAFKNDMLQSATLNSTVTASQVRDLHESYFDTQDSQKILPYVEYFPGVYPASYRLNLWCPDLSALDGPGVFKPNDFQETKKDEHNYTADPAYQCHAGRIASTVSNDKDLVLPSLNAGEQLFKLQVFDEQGRIVDPDLIKLNYSKSTQFYNVTLPKPGSYTIHYQVAFPKAKLVRQNTFLPQEIVDLVERYKQYRAEKAKEAKPEQGFQNLREFAQYIRRNEVGACRHRSLAAFEELEAQEQYKGRVRIVENDVHNYLEFQAADRAWYKLDLGGYPAQLVALPKQGQDFPVPVKEQFQKVEPIPELKFPMTVLSFEALIEKVTALSSEAVLEKDKETKELAKPVLIQVSSDLGLQEVLEQLRRHYPSEDLFIVSEPEALSLTAYGMSQEGEIKPAYTAFKRWLDAHQGKEGLIAMDIRQFNARELSQVNALLDGTLLKEQDAVSKLRIILIDSSERGIYGPDFRRRVPYQCTVPELAQRELLPELPEDQGDELIEIDLFNSPYWKLKLLGSWNLLKIENLEDKGAEEQEVFSFRWKKGELFAALNSGKQLVFKNPPLFDPDFKTFIAQLKGLRRLAWADQSIPIPEKICFYQAKTKGYEWPVLAQQVSLHPLSRDKKNRASLLVLSDANVLSFIEDPAYAFSAQKISSQHYYLKSREAHLTRCQQKRSTVDLVCAPGLSKSTLAQVLTKAKELAVPVRIFIPGYIPESSPLSALVETGCVFEEEKNSGLDQAQISLGVQFQVSADPYFSARQALDQNPKATYFDLSCLEASELGLFPIIDEQSKAKLLEKGYLSLQAQLSSIAEKLRAGETIILEGKVPSHLYEALTTLSLGQIDGQLFAGRVLVFVPPEDSALVEAITGEKLLPLFPQSLEKIALLKKRGLWEEDLECKEGPEPILFSELEGQALKRRFAKGLKSLISTEAKDKTEEERTQEVDECRLYNTELALSLNPWVKLEGPSGIGKTYFLQEILKTSETLQIVWSLEEWLEQKAETGKNLVLVLDEANFMSELSGQGEHFLERFNSLQATPPGFLWKGKYQVLSPEHKVIFAFNPASYGAGRSTQGFLEKHGLSLSFERLPYYYVRVRLITPLFEQLLPEELKNRYKEDPRWLSDPLVKVYQWILAQSKEQDCLITPREIKAMINLICSQIEKRQIREQETLEILASEVAYLIGKQTLSDSPALLAKFEQDFKPNRTLLDRQVIPKIYPVYQSKAYLQLRRLLEARSWLCQTKTSSSNDLGLGGIILEGGPGIGKTHFVNKLLTEYLATHYPRETLYQISSNTPYHEKERLLREAFNKGAIVIADEFNTSLWPNKLLNNFLMGLDEWGKPAQTPGFMLVLTQNPPSLLGRSEEDPALRRRFFKISVNDWPVYEKPKKWQTSSVVNSSMFKEKVQKELDQEDLDSPLPSLISWEGL